MLRELTAKQFLEWIAYSQIERFGQEREDARAALVARMIANVNRDPKVHEQPFPLNAFIKDFLEQLEELEAAPPKQTWQEKKEMAKAIVKAFGGKVETA